MTTLRIPITETPNELTVDIDMASPEGVLRILRQTDAQVFNGWRDFPGMYDAPTQSALAQVALEVGNILFASQRGGKGILAFTGCGTSGRVAFKTARTFNRVLSSSGKSPVCRYLTSGGDPALLLSIELPEDDPLLGQRELESLTAAADRVLFVGISCGISAPYVLGQVDWASEQDRFTTALMGFNPVEFARNFPVEGWDKTCKGPEPITGSTRMKGGTATKVLLEVAMVAGLEVASRLEAGVDPSTGLSASIIKTLKEYEATFRQVHLAGTAIAAIMQRAGQCLRSGGHLYYIGSGFAGLLGIVDSSEMVDTYGSDASEVRGFIASGWADMDNTGGVSLRDVSPYCHISEDDFLLEIAPTLTSVDMVVFIEASGARFSRLTEVLSVCQTRGAGGIGLLSVQPEPTELAATFPGLVAEILLPKVSPLPGTFLYEEIALKLGLNAISTGAQIMKGCVYMNRMINVGVLNNKLYYRSLELVSQFSGASSAVAETSLLSSIHEVDEVTDAIRALPISKHIMTATDKKNVVPIAMLLGTGKFNREAAAAALAKEPVIRMVAQSLYETHGAGKK